MLERVFDAVELDELTVRVDDGPETRLSVGPDRRRLVAAGDFNAEIDLDSVEPGTTTVALTARYRDGGVANEDAQIVDGRWEPNGRFVTTREVGYDRLIAVGDVRWRDVDVPVAVVIHGLETRAYSLPSVRGTGSKCGGRTNRSPLRGTSPRSGR